MNTPYILYYWPLPFRGNFVRCVFAYQGVSFVEPSMNELVELKQMEPQQQPYPFMAPPLLVDEDANVSLSQMTAIVYYLGQKFNLLPQSGQKTALVIKILADCVDVLSEVTRHHGNQMWDEASLQVFSTGRFVRWLKIFEETALRHDVTFEDGYFLNTPNATIADLSVFALWATMARCLPEVKDILRTHAPTVMALCDRLGEHEGLKQFVRAQEAQFGNLYCGGQIEQSLRSVLSD